MLECVCSGIGVLGMHAATPMVPHTAGQHTPVCLARAGMPMRPHRRTLPTSEAPGAPHACGSMRAHRFMGDDQVREGPLLQLGLLQRVRGGGTSSLATLRVGAAVRPCRAVVKLQEPAMAMGRRADGRACADGARS